MQSFSSIEADSELPLIKRTGEGDRQAFQQLYSIYEKRLYAYLMKMLECKEDAEELLVEVMLAVWQGAKSFRGRSKLSTWIFGIAHNKAMTRLASKSKRAITDLDQAKDLQAPEPSPHNRQLERESKEKIQAALRQLSHEHREVVELTFYHGLSYAEIAQIVKCPVNTIKTRMFYARQRLKQLLSQAGLEGAF